MRLHERHVGKTYTERTLKRYAMVFLWGTILIGVLALTASMARAGETQYRLDRAVEWIDGGNIEIEDVAGGALVTDGGPYTAMTRIAIDVGLCADLRASPAPACEPYELAIDEMVDSYALGGRIYRLESGEWLTVIRRGSEATGDPSLILYIDGMVMIFSEQNE